MGFWGFGVLGFWGFDADRANRELEEFRGKKEEN